MEHDRVLQGGRRRLAEGRREKNGSQENDGERYGKGGFKFHNARDDTTPAIKLGMRTASGSSATAMEQVASVVR